jgi:patatin-like phospholipase/acyl hydrolase
MHILSQFLMTVLASSLVKEARLLDYFKQIVAPKFKLPKKRSQILTSETFSLREHQRNTKKQKN